MRIRVTDDMLRDAVKSSHSMRDVLRNLGLRQAGGTQSHYTARAKKLDLDMTHFVGQGGFNRGKISSRRLTAEEILVKRDSGGRQKASLLVRALRECGVAHECKECGQLPEWRGNPLTLDVDHINEDWLDDRIENLRFLCPNCHSQFSRRLVGC